MCAHGGRIKGMCAWPPLQMSQHRYHAVSIPVRASYLNSNSAWCDSSLAATVVLPPRRGPDGKVAIVSHFTNADDCQVPGTSLENMQRLQIKALIFHLSVETSVFSIQIEWPPREALNFVCVNICLFSVGHKVLAMCLARLIICRVVKPSSEVIEKAWQGTVSHVYTAAVPTASAIREEKKKWLHSSKSLTYSAVKFPMGKHSF